MGRVGCSFKNAQQNQIGGEIMAGRSVWQSRIGITTSWQMMRWDGFSCYPKNGSSSSFLVLFSVLGFSSVVCFLTVWSFPGPLIPVCEVLPNFLRPLEYFVIFLRSSLLKVSMNLHLSALRIYWNSAQVNAANLYRCLIRLLWINDALQQRRLFN